MARWGREIRVFQPVQSMCHVCDTEPSRYTCALCKEHAYCSPLCEMVNLVVNDHRMHCKGIGVNIRGANLTDEATETFCLKSGLADKVCAFKKNQETSLIPRVRYIGEPLSLEGLYNILHPKSNNKHSEQFMRMFKISYRQLLKFQRKRAQKLVDDKTALTQSIIDEFESDSGFDAHGKKRTWKDSPMGDKELFIEKYKTAEEVLRNAQTLVDEINRKIGDFAASFAYDRDMLLNQIYEFELNPMTRMIGLKKIKNFSAMRIQQVIVSGEEVAKNFLNLMFLGEPGTGKTAASLNILIMYKHVGLLHSSRTDFEKVSRSEVVAGFSGQTAKLVRAFMARTLGSVAVVDEAYALYNGPGDSFGKEAINEFVSEMDNYEGMSAIIWLGYMQDIYNSILKVNKGMDRRNPDKIVLDPYDPEELFMIFMRNFTDPTKQPTLSNEAQDILKQYIVAGMNTRVGTRYPRHAGEELLVKCDPTAASAHGGDEDATACGSSVASGGDSCNRVIITSDEEAYVDAEEKNLFSDRNAGAMKFIYDRCLRIVSGNLLQNFSTGKVTVKFDSRNESFQVKRIITADVIREAFVAYAQDVLSEEVELIKFERGAVKILPRVFLKGSTAPREAFPRKEKTLEMSETLLATIRDLERDDILPPPTPAIPQSVAKAAKAKKDGKPPPVAAGGGGRRSGRAAPTRTSTRTTATVSASAASKRKRARTEAQKITQINEILRNDTVRNVPIVSLDRVISDLRISASDREAMKAAFRELPWSRNFKRKPVSNLLTDDLVKSIVKDAKTLGFLDDLYALVDTLGNDIGV